MSTWLVMLACVETIIFAGLPLLPSHLPLGLSVCGVMVGVILLEYGLLRRGEIASTGPVMILSTLVAMASLTGLIAIGIDFVKSPRDLSASTIPSVAVIAAIAAGSTFVTVTHARWATRDAIADE